MKKLLAIIAIPLLLFESRGDCSIPEMLPVGVDLLDSIATNPCQTTLLIQYSISNGSLTRLSADKNSTNSSFAQYWDGVANSAYDLINLIRAEETNSISGGITFRLIHRYTNNVNGVNVSKIGFVINTNIPISISLIGKSTFLSLIPKISELSISIDSLRSITYLNDSTNMFFQSIGDVTTLKNVTISSERARFVVVTENVTGLATNVYTESGYRIDQPLLTLSSGVTPTDLTTYYNYYNPISIDSYYYYYDFGYQYYYQYYNWRRAYNWYLSTYPAPVLELPSHNIEVWHTPTCDITVFGSTNLIDWNVISKTANAPDNGPLIIGDIDRAPSKYYRALAE